MKKKVLVIAGGLIVAGAVVGIYLHKKSAKMIPEFEDLEEDYFDDDFDDDDL